MCSAVVKPSTYGHCGNDRSGGRRNGPLLAFAPRQVFHSRSCQQKRALRVPGLETALQNLQIGTQLGSILVTPLLILFYSLIDDGFELDGNLRIYGVYGRRRLAENGFNNDAAGVSWKSFLPCRHFVQQQSQRKHVRAYIQIVAADLLG